MKKIATLVAFAFVFSVFSGCLSSLKAAMPKGPVKEIKITDIPSEYEGNFAMIIAATPEDANNSCWPSYMTYGYYDTAVPDTVKAGEVKVLIPCDNAKRLITLTFTKTKEKDKDDASSAGFIYVKDSGSDACKYKETIPTYSLSDTQAFSFSDFILNEKCKEIADAAKKGKFNP